MGSLCKQTGTNHLGCFILGAFLPTVLLFFLASDRVGERLSSISSLGNGYLSRSPAPDGANLTSSQHGSAPGGEEAGFAGLAELLPKVAMEDRTVILTQVNEAWARPGSLLDLFLESFKNGEDTAHLLDHLLVVALDPRGFERCKAVHPHCYLLRVTSVDMSSPKRFRSRDYLELVWTKLTFQQRVLELGYNFLFTDTDLLWFRNPLRRIPVYADMSCSSDDFNATRKPLDNPLNTGLYYVKSTNRSVEMIKHWRAARARFPAGWHDQQVFVAIRHELVAKLGAAIEPLETVYFGGFCEYHDDPEKVCTVHADCCIGLENKVHDLKDFAADWKNYTSLAPEERKKGGFKWTYPARCRKSSHWG
ncbi:hypothetical protein ACP4OV_030221 [Aristida adscensionis]